MSERRSQIERVVGVAVLAVFLLVPFTFVAYFRAGGERGWLWFTAAFAIFGWLAGHLSVTGNHRGLRTAQKNVKWSHRGSVAERFSK